jgi:glutamine cyclotransferase
MITRLIAALLLLSSAVAARADTEWDVVKTLPHDKKSFTEGFFVADGMLYESTGLVGKSDIRVISLADGKIVKRQAIDPKMFGEGIAPWKDRIISLTWQTGKGYVWNRSSLKLVKSFSYSGEGWGFTNDGKRLIMSDGTASLRFLDPETLKVTATLPVTWQGGPVRNLNELEYVNGEILANIWYSPLIARIDAKTGAIKDWINLAPLVAKNMDGDPDSVANGIAWDAKSGLLYVTGKNWPLIYALRLKK